MTNSKSGGKIEIILGKDGSIKVEGHNFTGGACIEAVEFLKKIYGDAVKTDLKSEYHENSINVVDGLSSGYCG